MDKSKTTQIRLSPSEVGKILLPGIVSIADYYIKNVVKCHFKNYAILPSWILNQLNNFYPHLDFQSAKQVKPRRWKINLFDNSCILTRQADEVLELPDGSWFIIAGLALLYFDPEYKNFEDDVILYRTKDQFLFAFKPILISIKLMKPEWVEDLCRNLFEILSSDTPPEEIGKCQGCNLLLEWLNKISNYLL